MSSNGYCPVCKENLAISPHHVKPRAEGGTDSPRNIVKLCKRCHDIIEEIYSQTGIRYSSKLIKLVRLRFEFTNRPQTRVQQVVEVVRRTPAYRFVQHRSPKPVPTPVTCPRCGKRHLPKKYSTVLCMECSGENGHILWKAEEDRIKLFAKEFECLRQRLKLPAPVGALTQLSSKVTTS